MPLRTLRSRLFYRLPGSALIMLACAVAMAATVALLGLVVWRDRVQTLAAAQMIADTDGGLLAERAARLVMTGDFLLQRVVASGGAGNGEGLEAVVRVTPRASTAWIADATGRIHHSYPVSAPPPPDDILQTLRTATESPVIRRDGSRQPGEEGEAPLILARPITGRDGALLGYGAVALAGRALNEALLPPSAPQAAQVRLIDRSGTLLAVVPGDTALDGDSLDVDHEVPGYPLTIQVAVSRAGALSDWRGRISEYTAYGTGAMLMILGIGMVALHRARREREAEDALQRAYDTLEERVGLRTVELTDTNARLEQALSDKEILLKEVQHRVKNNLQVICSLLRLQAGRLHGPSRTAFDESLRRIQSMSLVHELLYRSPEPSRIDLADYLRQLCDSLLRSTGPSAIRLTVTAEPWVVDVDRAMPLAMIASELVSNALRHAHPAGGKGLVQVSLSLLEPGKAGINLSVRDDGVGLPAHVVNAGDTQAANRPTSQGGLGLVLVQSLAAQAGARLSIDRGIDQDAGTGFTVTVPAAAKAA